MASSEQQPRDECPLDLQPGEAALATLSNRDSPIAHLPPEALENLLVVTVASPERVERAVREAGGDPNDVGIVPVSASPVQYEGPCWIAERVSPSDLTGISIQFSRGERYLAEGTGWVVVEGLGTMLMYVEEAKLYRLLSHFVTRARGRRLRHVTGLVDEVVSSETLARFRELHDRSVSLK
ncbi:MULTISPECIES: DUF7504 family protein [Halolamina]|uniref:Uncharacterized protein n=1 Tax=Halolamina pelagica TaxID=699431 RepID=A0A1I5Q373_9EURY|nr:MULTISPECIES: hypothetical protein [Halolamina]NHX35069.1 hypothetical protein [Halolamina sp. R1-12]SFP40470.1 hypothetical protein SAMN05216277_103227 [Halolamina pelagica]